MIKWIPGNFINLTLYRTYVDSPGKWDNSSIKELLDKLLKEQNIEGEYSSNGMMWR